MPKQICQDKCRADLESPPGSGGEGGSPGVGGLRKSDGTSAGGLGALRTVQAPPPRTTRTSEPIILPPLEVESRLTSTRWRARRRRTEAQASAFGNAPSSSLLLVTAPGRVARGGARRALACTARAGRSRVLLAKLLGEGDNQINLDFFDERVSNARAGWLWVASYTSEKATHPLGSRKDEA